MYSLKDHNLLNCMKMITSNTKIKNNWKDSVIGKESTLHQIAPYIGKMKSSMARELITTFTQKEHTIYDPFCGSGTIALEAWIHKRHIIANDLSPYAYVITKAKLFPFQSREYALNELGNIEKQANAFLSNVDLSKIPHWVQLFFHPDTLREIIAWVHVLKTNESFFLLSCLLGILHHQRPGFLSYPSSHTVPYLRQKKFPASSYPELYEYREVRERLEKKVVRAFRRIPHLNFQIIRKCHMFHARNFIPERKIAAIITSPPYMRQLDYGRDNRLRLWFLGLMDWKTLDQTISPSESNFIKLFQSCLRLWKEVLIPEGLCILVVGDTMSKTYKMTIPEVIIHIATKEVGGYSALCKFSDDIPEIRRVRRGYSGNKQEIIIVLRKKK